MIAGTPSIVANARSCVSPAGRRLWHIFLKAAPDTALRAASHSTILAGMRYTTLAQDTRHEIVILKSRFIASGCEVVSVEQAESFLKNMRQTYPDASHHCYAFRVLGPPVVDRFSDDGEPSGTAGRPILTVLEHNLANAIVVVTRYFGGTKLGTGGLVKAYTQATQALIAAAGVIDKEPCQSLVLHYPYHLGGSIAYKLQEAGLEPDLTYSEVICCRVDVPVSQKDALLARLQHAELRVEIF
jgi:uncharacterized YigZ family protein